MERNSSSASSSASQSVISDSPIGQVVDGRYRLLSVIARGSMGRVYRAEQLQLDRLVAIKVMELNPSFINDADTDAYRQRFMNEAAALARLQHPNTVRMFDFGFWDGAPFMVMEFLEGQTLSRLIRQEGRLEPVRTLRIAEQVCRSLAEAHDSGIVHRDLNPGNILILPSEDGDRVKVLDFGLVKAMEGAPELTTAGQIVGSPNYMPPELIRESTGIDGRADIYSVGVTPFRMLTGNLPFKRDGTAAVLVAHLHTPAPTLSSVAADLRVPPAVEWVVARTLEKDPADRIASASALRRALRAARHAASHSGL